MAVSTPSLASVPDQSSFTYGTSYEATIGGVYQDSGASLSSGQQAAARVTQYRALHSNLRDNSGNALGVSGNPLVVTSSGSSGVPINSFESISAITPGSTGYLQYTVGMGETFYLNQVFIASPGRFMFQLQVETGVSTGLYNTYFTGFGTASGSNVNLTLQNALPVTAGIIIQVAFTNNDQINLNAYATVCGYENP
jgi:hypothetical protein